MTVPISDYETIQFQIQYLTDRSEKLKDSELKWLYIISDEFEAKGQLTEKKRKVLDDIYERY